MEFLKRLRSEYRVRKAVRRIEPESLEDEILTVFGKAFSQDKQGKMLQQHKETVNKRKILRKEIYRRHPDWKNNAPKPEAIVMVKVN